MARYNVFFNGNSLPRYVKVVNVSNSILPEVTHSAMDIPNRVGQYFFGANLGARRIDIEVILLGQDEKQIPMLMAEMAKWLLYDEPKKLILGDNPRIYYNAMFVGDSTIEQLSRMGRTTLSFICYDPLGHSDEVISHFKQGGDIRITNAGTAPTYPIITMRATKDITGFNIVSSNEAIVVGKGLGVSEKMVDYSPYALDDWLNSLNPWTQSSGMALPNTYVDLQKDAWELFEGTTARINEGAWKTTGSKWHGGALERSCNSPVQDFDFIMPVHFNATKKRARGKIETNGKDSRGGYLFCVEYVDDEIDSENLKINIYLYGGDGRKTLIHRNMFSNNEADFIGGVRVIREGKRWTIKYERRISKEQNDDWKTGEGLKLVGSYIYHDNAGNFNRQLGGVQMGMATWGNYQEEEKGEEGKITKPALLRCYMSVYNVFVKRLDEIRYEENTVSVAVRKNDIIKIDCEEGAIYKNGQYFMNYMSPASTFIKLSRMENLINISPYDAFDNISIAITPAWY